MEASSPPWNNPDAGMHPLPPDPLEVAASVRAAIRCTSLFPYLGMRFGDRGDAFARTDSGYLASLVPHSNEYVVVQSKWLARVLASRGMPRWLMECHLDILAEELTAALPEHHTGYAKLSHAAAALRAERQAVIPQEAFEALAAEFAAQSGDRVANFGGLVVSAVCDESCGLEFAVPSLVGWADNDERFPADWRAALRELLDHARRRANPQLLRP
jgi:hypothetical protein